MWVYHNNIYFHSDIKIINNLIVNVGLELIVFSSKFIEELIGNKTLLHIICHIVKIIVYGDW